MPEISTVSQKTQIGVETTPGTPVAATKILTASQIAPGQQASTTPYRASGFKVNNVVVRGKEWTEAGISGPLTYTEPVYFLNSLMKAVTTPAVPTNTPTATVGKRWVFNSSPNSEDTIKTLTVEQGSTTRGKRFGYGIVTSWGFTANRDSVTQTGSLMGQLLEDPFTMTTLASAAEIPLIPVLPDHINLYIASTAAGLDAASVLNRGFEFTVGIGNKVAPVWPLRRANTSWAAPVETPIEYTASITMEADTEGMALLTNFRANTKVFIRLQAQGAQIEAGTPGVYELFQFDFCGFISEPGGYGDQDGVVSKTWGLTGSSDSTWGKMYECIIHNTMAAL